LSKIPVLFSKTGIISYAIVNMVLPQNCLFVRAAIPLELVVSQTKRPILIIENNSPTLELYRRELGRFFKVLACSELAEAQALMRTPRLAAVVLEPEIADGQGWNLLFELKHFFHGNSLPVILCSTMDERKRGLEAGAADYLVKPVLPPVLVETIQRVIRSSAKV